MKLPSAGFLKRFGWQCIALFCGDNADRHCAVRGHWLYVRQCSQAGADGLKLIRFQDPDDPPAQWCVVLGKGERVAVDRKGEPRSIEQKAMPPARWLSDELRVGDRVLVPGKHPWGIRRSALATTAADEFFVDESVLLAKYEE